MKLYSYSRPLFSSFAASALLAVVAVAQSNPPARPDDPSRQETTSPATPPLPAQSLTQATAESQLPAEVDRFTAESTRFKTLDTDSDGRLSRAEFTLAPNQPIEKASGATELSSAPKKPWWSRRSTGQNASGATDSNIGTPTDVVEVFEQLDTDKDGFLSRAELAAEQEKKAGK